MFKVHCKVPLFDYTSDIERTYEHETKASAELEREHFEKQGYTSWVTRDGVRLT